MFLHSLVKPIHIRQCHYLHNNHRFVAIINSDGNLAHVVCKHLDLAAENTSLRGW